MGGTVGKRTMPIEVMPGAGETADHVYWMGQACLPKSAFEEENVIFVVFNEQDGLWV